MENVIVDLDALAPAYGTIVLDGKEIKVRQPTMDEMVKLSKYFAGGPSDTITPEMEQHIIDLFVQIIPELEGRDLGVGQRLALFDLLNKMVKPEAIAKQADIAVPVEGENPKEIKESIPT